MIDLVLVDIALLGTFVILFRVEVDDEPEGIYITVVPRWRKR